ncbi:hypothetical protein [Photobacterium angustum]|nr:hypothetical protein [Photobacterium angustum]
MMFTIILRFSPLQKIGLLKNSFFRKKEDKGKYKKIYRKKTDLKKDKKTI